MSDYAVFEWVNSSDFLLPVGNKISKLEDVPKWPWRILSISQSSLVKLADHQTNGKTYFSKYSWFKIPLTLIISAPIGNSFLLL